MAEKITLKNALANLPQKTDVDSIVAKDASGNPVFIKKSDLAEVVAELMPVATAEKNGLMNKLQYVNYGNVSNKSFNEVLDLGRYVFSKENFSDSDMPQKGGYGILEVIAVSGHQYRLQRFTFVDTKDSNKAKVMIRLSLDKGKTWEVIE